MTGSLKKCDTDKSVIMKKNNYSHTVNFSSNLCTLMIKTLKVPKQVDISKAPDSRNSTIMIQTN